MIDRKRKFLDTDLAHDSEGSAALPSVVACSYGSLRKLRTQPASSLFPLGEFSSFWCLLFSIPELFQDLSQLQETCLQLTKPLEVD